MLTFYDFNEPGGPSGDVTIAVQDFVTSTGTGAQSFTSSTITGVTPAAALIVGALHDPTNDPGETPGAIWSIGFVDASRSNHTRAFVRDNVTSTFTSSNHSPTQAYRLLNNGGTSIKAAAGSLVSGGVSLDFTTNSSPSLRSFFVAFAGADVSARADGHALGTGTSAQDITAPAFEPDVVIVSGHGYGGNTGNAPMFANFGIAVNDGSDTQRCVLWSEASGAADGSAFQTLRNDAALGKVSTSDGSLIYRGTISDFDANGFSITNNASAGSNLVNYLALKFAGRQVKLVDFDTPTTTGSHTITGAGFTPSFALAVVTNLEAVNDHPGATSDNMGGFSVCAIGSDEQWCASWRSDSGAATTDTGSQIANAALMGASDTDCDAFAATFTAWTSDGVTLNVTAAQGAAKKGFVLFVE